MQSFDEYRFKSKVDSALQKVKTILENTRSPQYPSDVPHKYDDKYGLAEFVTNISSAAQLNCLELLGVNDKYLKQMVEWSKTRSVTIRLKAEENCSFDKEVTRKVESKTEYVSTYTSSSGHSATRTDKVVTTVTEYFWWFDFEYELFVFKGNDINEKITLQGRKGRVSIMTSTKSTPKPQVTVRPSIDVNITWLLQHLSDNLQLKFSIDRNQKSCRTPRRNTEIESAISHFSSFRNWASSVHSYFTGTLFPVQSDHGLNLGQITDSPIFNPVLPLFEEPKGAPAKESKSRAIVTVELNAPTYKGSPVLPVGDANIFLNEQKRSFSEKFDELSKAFPDGNKIITIAEANMLVVMLHSQQLTQSFYDGINYIEEMLRKQLVSAIGKEVGAVDFTNYMRFHNRKLYRGKYEPIPFYYAIRRPDHYPEGLVGIEAQQDDGTLADPIYTTVRHIPNATPMSFPINAATRITFGGDRYLHAWVNHQFEGYSGQSLNLVARARQFSCFMLLVGRIVSADVFEPKHAIILQNKDDLKIPLLLEQIPTPKQFRDAIESLSPEQQRFCKAFRAMQLESTLFGVAVIQIKPQLEKLLNLPYDSLTKEIKMTQELMELFIKYQIPSDLLSYEGEKNASVHTKVNEVQKHIKNMYEMINISKQKELAEIKQEAQYKVYDGAAKDSEPVQLLSQISQGRTLRALGGVPRQSSEASIASTSTGSAAPQKRSSAISPSPAKSTTTGGAKPASGPVQKTAPPPSPAPTQPQQPGQQTQQNQVVQVDNKELTAVGGDEEVVGIDFTKIPAELDNQFSELDEDNCLRPTIINPGLTWSKKSQKALLAEPSTSSLSTTEQGEERNKAFDLLDALSRSGALSIDYASLHVLIAATHCFDKSLMNTLIQDNVNPIEKVERSSLIIAQVIQDKPATDLIKHDQLERVSTYSPGLFKNQGALESGGSNAQGQLTDGSGAGTTESIIQDKGKQKEAVTVGK